MSGPRPSPAPTPAGIIGFLAALTGDNIGFAIGHFGGEHIGSIYHYVTTYSLYALIAAVVLALLWTAHRVRRHRKRHREYAARAERATAERR